MFLLVVVSGFGSVTAMEWMKSKLGYGPQPESYEEYFERWKRNAPLWSQYVSLVVKMPTEWPASEVEQQKLVEQVRDFAKRYERNDFDQKMVNYYIEQSADKAKLEKQEEVLNKALEKIEQRARL